MEYDKQREMESISNRLAKWNYLGEGGVDEDYDARGGGVPMNIADDDIEQGNTKFKGFRDAYDGAVEQFETDINQNIISWYRLCKNFS